MQAASASTSTQGFKYVFDPKNRSHGITEIPEFWKYRSKFGLNLDFKIWSNFF
jgi:hypothetical protein